MKYKRLLISAMLLVGALLPACRSSAPTSQNTSSVPGSHVSTQSPQSKATDTLEPSATSTPPIPTSTLTLSPTPTSIPVGPSLLAQLGKGLLKTVSLSPDGQILTVISNLGLYLLDANNLQEIDHFSLKEQEITAVVWSPDGSRILLGSDQGLVVTLNPGSWDTLEKVEFEGRIYQLAFAPYTDSVAVIVQVDPDQGTSGKTVHLWDLDTWQTRTLLTRKDVPEDEEYSISRVVWSPDGNSIAAGTFSGSVYIQAVNSTEQARVLHPYPGTLANQKILDLAWSPDVGQIAVTWKESNPGLGTSGQTEELVMIWDIQQNQVLETYSAASGDFVSWLPDGTLVTVENQKLVFHNPKKATVQQIPLSHSVHRASWSGNYRYLLLQSYSGSLTIWDHEQQAARTANLNDFYVQGISQTGWSSHGDLLAALGFANGRLSTWDSQGEFNPRATLEGISQFSWSPLDDTLAAVNYDHELALYKGTSLEKIRSYPIPANQSIDALAWSPDGNKIALLIQKYQVYGMAAELLDAWITILGVDSFTPLHRFGVMDDMAGYGQSNGVTCLAWNPDNQKLAGGNYHGEIIIWDSTKGQVIQTMSGHKHAVNAMDWSPDGSQLLSGSLDGTAAIWEPASGSMRRQYRNFPGEYKGDVRDVDWKRDSDWFAVGAWGEIRILGRTTTYKIPFTHGSIHDIEWSNTAPLLAVSGNGLVQVWKLP